MFTGPDKLPGLSRNRPQRLEFAHRKFPKQKQSFLFLSKVVKCIFK